MAELRSDRDKRTQSQSEQSPQRKSTTRRETSRALSPRSRSEIGRSPFDFGSSPFELMRALTDQMFGSGMGSGLFRTTEGIWSPQIEVFERDGKLVVRADLPGMSRDEVNIEARDNALIIEGERREERKEDNEGYFLTERKYGHFQRVIPLPDGVNPEKARATFRDGVLELTMDAPKNGRKGKTIEIEEARS